MTVSLPHGDPAVLAEAAGVEAGVETIELGELRQSSNLSKCKNMISLPRNSIGPVRRLADAEEDKNIRRRGAKLAA